ncbi:hypothetical protein C8Q80DRAFT_1093334 [Daedaleopsis nitida]|nr:hypothetical protein C8Q80DRAFT_1093334 [Daedaleopsis nitida]
MDILKKFKIPGLSTPPAPKFKPLDLPATGEGELPPLVPGWSSSDSGSSASSSSPTTPATSPVSWRRPRTPYKSAYKPPSVRSPTPQYEMRSPAWHVMTTELEKSSSRQTFTPSPEIMKPRPRHASSTHHPSPLQVMQGLISPQPMPAKPLKSILKHSAPPSSIAPSPAPPSVRPNEIKLHWQLCPRNMRKAHSLQLDFDVTKPVDLIVIRDYSQGFPRKLSSRDVKGYLDRKVCEAPALRKMTIKYQNLPQWEVNVTRADGDVIRVRDVFQAIYDNLRLTVNRSERAQFIVPSSNIKRCSDAFIARYEASTLTTPRAEQRAGMRRVDLLMGENTFLGLTRPANDEDDFWYAHFGSTPSSPQ